MSPDIINGLFELVGAYMLYLNVKSLQKDKVFKGIHMGAPMFFGAWGLWNLFYYPHLDQWFSFTGGVLLVIMNLWWVGLAIYYTKFYIPEEFKV